MPTVGRMFVPLAAKSASRKRIHVRVVLFRSDVHQSEKGMRNIVV